MKKAVFVFIFAVSVVCQVFSDEIDEVRELLAAEKGGEILFLSKINLGIPEGETWLADRSDEWARIYFIDSDNNVSIITSRTFAEPSEIKFNSKEDLEFDIMRDIPGTRIGNKAATFGDFNGDGLDEIFDFYNTESLCTITGYNSDNGKRESLFGYRYTVKDPRGSSPVEFIYNQGVYDIKVNLYISREKQYIWVYFEWDEAQRRWVEDEEWQESNIEPSLPVLTEQNTDELVEDRGVQKKTAFTPTDSRESTRFNLYIVIAAAIIALAAVTVFIVVSKEEKMKHIIQAIGNE